MRAVVNLFADAGLNGLGRFGVRHHVLNRKPTERCDEARWNCGEPTRTGIGRHHLGEPRAIGVRCVPPPALLDDQGLDSCLTESQCGDATAVTAPDHDRREVRRGILSAEQPVATQGNRPDTDTTCSEGDRAKKPSAGEI